MEALILCALCLGGALCAAPLRVNISAGKGLRAETRYLWFRRRIAPGPGLRGLVRRIFPVLRGAGKPRRGLFPGPPRPDRLCLRAAVSTGDAAETALLHGGLCLAAGLLSSLPARTSPKVFIEPCFGSGKKFTLDCDISFSMPGALYLGRILVLAVLKKRKTHV
ncbi:MAG: hypothetical protein LBE02_08890 [Spirochaetaceae bacterium]|jgi:hypothetical protein|nr:hypothetical protein [Spirochaetaceae bacterium]